MTATDVHTAPAPAPVLLHGCALIAALGAVGLVVGNIAAGMIVPNHDWVAETISDLGAGKHEIVQDVALHGFAAAFLAAAIGAANLHLGGKRWSLGVLCLALLALCVEMVAVRNEYGDGDSDGIVIHGYLVYALGGLFGAVTLLMADGLERFAPSLRLASYGVAAIWAFAAPAFFFVSTEIDGAWERGLGLIAVGYVLMLSWVFFRAVRSH